MRLLQRHSTGEFSLTKDLADDEIPQYTILSHTWGADTEEVTFQDLRDGTGKNKSGYQKIRFCAEQASRDGFQYFWVDTCCIDKSNSTELSEAINSMFRWYQDAAKCYVYLADVERPVLDANEDSIQPFWEPAFRNCRWFTRGWALQELLAPASVDFFSKEGEYLGNKRSLERLVSEITGIPINALRGSPLSSFRVAERMVWAEKRETKRKEDKAYSLLGIFDVSMPLIYGEGREKATKRLREEIDRAWKGIKHDDFSVAFSLSEVSDIENFVAREEELIEMHKALSSDGSRRTIVLHGLGGIGKTQLSIAYTKRYKDSYSAIFWLNIKDEDSLKQSFAKVAKQILREHPSARWLSSVDIKENLDEVVDAVKAWLSLPDNTRWLIIYDNYDNPKLPGIIDPTAVDIRKFLPESYQGSVIITTRSSQVKAGYSIQIRKLQNVCDSLKILSNTSKREGLINDPDAIKIAEELDGLPLALATAGAYLDQATISLSDYLQLYKDSWMKLLKTSPRLTSYEDRTLYSTWQLSFKRVKEQNELSAKLLRLWAYFDNKDIWFELLRHGNSEDPEWIRELTEDQLNFHNAVRVLSNYGLAEAETSSQEWIDSGGYSIHSCVHSWTIHVLNQEWDYDLARLALKFVGSHVPGQKAAKWWLTQQRLLQHAARCSDLIFSGLVADDGIEWALHELGLLYADQGKLDEAEKMYQRALQGREKALGRDHMLTLNTVNNLGNLYKSQGKLDKTEEMCWRALQGREKALGPDHKSTLDAVNNLGNLYADQGKLEEAEKMYQRALEGLAKALGPDHISILDSLHCLAILRQKQGKLDKAEKIYQQVLQGYKKALGPDHTSILMTFNNLGNLYKFQDKLDEAENMYQLALQGFKKALGPDHISTLDAVNNLGCLYADQGKLDEAKKMYQWALQGREKALGPDHILTLDTVNNLGNLYANQGKLDEAENMYQRALKGHEKALGPDHASTLIMVNNLGNIYKSREKWNEAEKMYLQALQGREKALGPDHTSTLDTVNNLGNLYADQGKLDEAEKMYQRALQGYEKALGTDHTSTVITVNNLGLLYQSQGKLEEAEKMYQQALQTREKALGPDHILTLDTVSNLGTLYADRGKLDEAEKMYQQAVQGYKKALGPDHTSTLMTVNNLGFLYKSQGKLDEAEKLYQQALQGHEKALGSNHTLTLTTVNNLGLLYKSQGKLDEAEKMYQRALQGYEKELSPSAVLKHRQALNTIWNLGDLFTDQGNLNSAEIMYSRARTGFSTLLGPSSDEYLHLTRCIQSLHSIEDPSDNVDKLAEGAAANNVKGKPRSLMEKIAHKILR